MFCVAEPESTVHLFSDCLRPSKFSKDIQAYFLNRTGQFVQIGGKEDTTYSEHRNVRTHFVVNSMIVNVQIPHSQSKVF